MLIVVIALVLIVFALILILIVIRLTAYVLTLVLTLTHVFIVILILVVSSFLFCYSCSYYYDGHHCSLEPQTSTRMTSLALDPSLRCEADSPSPGRLPPSSGGGIEHELLSVITLIGAAYV